MIAGAVAISTAAPPASEQASWRAAMSRECARYHLDPASVEAAGKGDDPLSSKVLGRRWWDIPIVATAVGVFIWLARGTSRPPMAMNSAWVVLLTIAMLAFLFVCGRLLWKLTRFS
jgi:hypothetical protein